MAHLLLCTVQAHKFWSNRSQYTQKKERDGAKQEDKKYTTYIFITNDMILYVVHKIFDSIYNTNRTMIMYQTHIHIIKNI